MITLGVITNTIDKDFERMLASVPKSITRLCILDNTNDPAAAQYWHHLETEYAVRVIAYPGELRDFAAARNEIIQLCQTEWLLFLDSDEVFTNSQSDLSRTITQAEAAEATAISLVRSDIFHAKRLRFGEAGRQKIIRLFKPSKVRYQGATHEEPIANGSVLASGLQIAHYSHQNTAAFISDVSKYALRVAAARNTGQLQNLFELSCFPLGKFVYNLVFRLGLLDGWRGTTYATCMSLHSLLVRIYRYEHFLKEK